MTPAEQRAKLAEAEATARRIAATFEAAAQREPDSIRRRVLERGADEIRTAIATTWPRVRNVRPLGRAAWQSREADAAGRDSDALTVSPISAGAP